MQYSCNTERSCQCPCPKPCPRPCPAPCPPVCPTPCPPPIPPRPLVAYFTATTIAIPDLTTAIVPINFVPTATSPGITSTTVGTASAIRFTQAGTYLVSLDLTYTTSADYVGTGAIRVGPVLSSGTAVPAPFDTPVLTAGTTGRIAYTVFVTVPAGATLYFNTQLTAAPTAGTVTLNSGQITAFRIA